MEQTYRSPVPFYVIGALWLLSGLLLPLYRVSHIAILAVVSALAFWGVNALASSGKVIGAADKAPPKATTSTATTGNPEIDKMLKEGNLAISEMKRLDDNIIDPALSEDIVRLEELSRKIFDAVVADPKKLPQIRRFMDYYLPTTLKLLNTYDRMSAVGVAGENIDTTLKQVEEMMDTVVKAFEKQLDGLYGAEALDISTDISVLETMMAREGLTGQTLKADTIPKETDIKLEL